MWFFSNVLETKNKYDLWFRRVEIKSHTTGNVNHQKHSNQYILSICMLPNLGYRCAYSEIQKNVEVEWWR